MSFYLESASVMGNKINEFAKVFGNAVEDGKPEGIRRSTFEADAPKRLID